MKNIGILKIKPKKRQWHRSRRNQKEWLIPIDIEKPSILCNILIKKSNFN